METEIPLKCHVSTILPSSGIFPLTGILMEYYNGILMEF